MKYKEHNGTAFRPPNTRKLGSEHLRHFSSSIPAVTLFLWTPIKLNRLN